MKHFSLILVCLSVICSLGVASCEKITKDKADKEVAMVSSYLDVTNITPPALAVRNPSRALIPDDMSSGLNEGVAVLTDAAGKLDSLRNQLTLLGYPGLVAGLISLIGSWVTGIIDYFKRKKEDADESK